MFDEKPKNEDKPKNEEIRAQLSFYRVMAVLLGIGIVAMIVIFVVLPHLFPPAAEAVEAVKYCGDYPCKEEPALLTDGFKAMFDCLTPMVTIGFSFMLATSMLGLILRMLGGGK